MLKQMGVALAIGAGIGLVAGPADAIQVTVTQVSKNSDGSSTYHFSVRTDQNESLVPNQDFVTIYNFAGIVGTPKSPPGWTFSSEDYGRTPIWGGYPAVWPVDIPGLTNLTWTTKRPVPAGTEVTGFEATTNVSATTDGEYAAQSTRSAGSKGNKQATIGQISTPAFLSH